MGWLFVPPIPHTPQIWHKFKIYFYVLIKISIIIVNYTTIAVI